MKNYFETLVRKFRFWIRFQMLEADKDMIKASKKILDNIEIKVEEKKGCNHDKLKKIIEKDTWYQCKECKMVFNLEYAIGWNERPFKNLIIKLKDELKIKEKGCKKK